jgi:predicted AAA+ superfamily ATPase
MNDILKAAFIFVAPQADPETHRQWIKTPKVHLVVVGVKNYADAVSTAKELLAEGIVVIELCAGFGNKGVSMIQEAVEGKIPVGVVRFDNHPGLGNVSGDRLFA